MQREPCKLQETMERTPCSLMWPLRATPESTFNRRGRTLKHVRFHPLHVNLEEKHALAFVQLPCARHSLSPCMLARLHVVW